MKILDYEMVNGSASDTAAFEKRVKELVAQGWEVYGTPGVGTLGGVTSRLFQCMVKPDPAGKKSCRWIEPTATAPGRWEPVKPQRI